MEARPHPRQAERLAALRSYEVLDTDREADFDDIAKLASALCDAPISVVNLIDEDRQWFKAEVGLGVRSTPLATSLCSHVILDDKFVEIPDTLSDPRMCDNPLCVGDPGLRFYAGAQLVTDDGLPLGTLCVLDHKPRTLSPLQRDALRVLARQVMVQLEMRKSLRHAALLRREVDHRVKNSLQTVTAYARLKARNLTSEEARIAVGEVGQRIAAVAMLHEQLYRTDAGPVVDLVRYISNLREYLSGFAPGGVSVALELDPGEVKVDSSKAAAVGTLLSEFVGNAFKHGFPDGKGGTVTLRLDRIDDENVRVSCSDDGVGAPPTPISQSSGLGFAVARAMAEQLGTTLEFDSGDRGFAVSFVLRAG